MDQKAHYTVDHFFRHEYGRMVSFLTKRFGAHHLDQIEDAVQETLIKAMQVWSFKGTPENPSAWVLRVAGNKMIDYLRREATFNKKNESFISDIDLEQKAEEVLLDAELSDDLLKMMFACCHPLLSHESQIILVLKVLAGFNKSEIARALLKSEEAVIKAYTRAKAKFKKVNKKLEVPLGRDLENRLDIIAKIIYLIYNEGYNSISTDELIRKDLCFEAMRLNKLLLDNKLLSKPKLHALMALMCFQSSRFESRVSSAGKLLTLEEQDRSRWNYQLIHQGGHHLSLSTAFGTISEYHLQASIAACYSFAPSFAATDWHQILQLYDALLMIKPDAITALNRIVVISKTNGAEVALKQLDAMESGKLKNNYLFYAIRASLYVELGKIAAAKEDYKHALTLTINKYEQQFFKSKIKNMGALPSGG